MGHFKAKSDSQSGKDIVSCLAALVGDEACLDELERKLNAFNVFDVLKSGHHELKHSNVLAWLLAPHENHLLGRRFFDAFVKRLAIVCAKPDFLVKAYVGEDVDVRVHREMMHIDLLVEISSNKVVFAIENKIRAKEHDRQLSRYRQTLENIYKDADGWCRYYFYLTPSGDASKNDSENWISVSYSDILETVREVASSMDASNAAKRFVEDYCTIIERDVMNQSDVEELCHKIYNRHTAALNQIFEVVGQGESPIRSVIMDSLHQLEEEGISICAEKGLYMKPAFHTADMDAFLGRKTSERGGTWGNDYLYVYFFDLRNRSKLVVCIEVGFLNVNDDENAKINAMIRAANKERKRDAERVCRLWRSKPFNATDCEEGQLRSWVKKSVQEAVVLGKGWIEKAKINLPNVHVTT